MKTIQELLELANTAVILQASGQKVQSAEIFTRYSPHVNKLCIDYYPSGWSADKNVRYESCDIDLANPASIQEGYWFLHNRKLC